MKRERLKRIVAFYLALNIFFEVVSPSLALALTSGPGQPEMASFEPVGTTEMVDIFSGDFNYNIPLLTVPGPNGGYPVNMAYHAGIGMDDEASWVGLGWNINPGVITRNMRGLPDDFSGEKVNKKLNMRPNRTVGINFGIPFTSVPEIWGFKLKQALKLGLSWNNYRGFGFAGGYSLSASSSKSNSFLPKASLNYNSLSGETDLTAGFSLGASRDAANRFGLSANMNSLHGLKDLQFTYSKSVTKTKGEIQNIGPISFLQSSSGTSSTSGGVSFASSSFVPPSEMPQSGFNISAAFSIGLDGAGVDNRLQINASYDQTSYDQNDIDFTAFGYLYANNRTASMSQNNDADDYRLMDFNREHEVSPSKDVPSMPATISTYDIYMASGQGIGGIFRPFRTDIGLLVDPEINGKNVGGALGVEVGLGYPNLNVGVNLALNYSKNYTGPWQKDDLWDDIKSRTYKGTTYFKAAGEMVADEDEENKFNMSYKPFPITTMVSLPDFSDISLDPSDMAELMSPIVDIRVNNTGGIIDQDHYVSKKTRSQLMSYKTFSEIGNIFKYQDHWVDRHIYSENASPLSSGNLTNSNPGSSQIGELSVINADGNRYIYALPAQNTIQKEVTFSIKNTGSNSPDEKIINYVGGLDNSVNNNQLDDHFFSSTEIPSYVHSYMLTAIVSPDYVDLKDDGLTDDDFGYWVKFNYTKTSSNYKWRAPFSGANYIKGYLSDDNDDKAGYTYGEKEIWYLNSIETKSHIANFNLKDRSDGKAASAENSIYTGTPNSASWNSANELKALDKISLYSKSNPAVPIKEVNFDYSYDLCKNTLNSAASTHGKLTLKKVWFTYMGNAKGSLSPYVFDYNEDVTDENPNYSILNEDRWGNYKENTFGVNSNLFPYTPQSSDYNGDNATNNDDQGADLIKRNAHASAWTLKEITLPSGGKIKVNYEADDYAYVHEKKAMEMVRVIGFSSSPTSPISNDMKAENEYLFFELNDYDAATTYGDTYVKKYVSGLNEIYFKMYIDLKKNGIEGIPKKDYVSGYAEITQSACGAVAANYVDPVSGRTLKLGYVKVNKVSIHDIGGYPYTHAFRKAAWQYLKLERRDVLFPSSNNSNSSGGGGAQFVKQVANSIIGAVQSATQLFTGYYSYCQAASFGKEMSKDNPSFIRLNTPDGIKYGGGHRVKSVVITDSWKETKPDNVPSAEHESEYGQEYTYRLPDGTSSGVANYEPLIGGEEIPHRKPIRYSSPYFLFKNQNLYLEEPIGESYYPGASVGYSRVVVKNIKQTETPSSSSEIKKTRDGVTVHEFYTSKDFPIRISRSALEHEKFNPKIQIPFIGSIGFENHGFSQWMEVVTNDMHGKPKSVATYNAYSDINNPNALPVNRVDYIYNTSNSGGLNSKVNALFQDGYYKETTMGLTTEQYIDMRETYGVSMNQGLQANIYITFAVVAPIPVFIPAPIIDYSESLNKSIVSMRVKNQSGILMETRTFNEGSTVTSKNLMFDAYSGKPLLTSVTNDFDKPIYKYDYSAQWAYNGMSNAYKNDRAVVNFNTDSNGHLVLTSGNTSDGLFPGDELLVNDGGTYTKAWIKNIVNSTEAVLIREDGQNAIGANRPGLIGLVIKSGRRNQQSISNASIVSLSNPVADRKYNLFTDYNLHVSPTDLTSTDCGTNITRSYEKTFSSNGINSIIKLSHCPEKNPLDKLCCDVILTFPLDNSINWSAVNLKKAGPKVYALHPTSGQVLSTGEINDQCGLTECLDGVLNASAAEFKDTNWEYDYPDVGDPVVSLGTSGNSNISVAAANANNNPYKLGLQGIWRMDKVFAYQTQRKQNTNVTDPNTTKIQEDGTFNDFVLYDWTKNTNTELPPLNQKWTKTNEVTKYNPYGFEIENKNAIDIYTSALFGYNNSLQTAIANNASYYEIAFEGFEDHGSNTTYTKFNGHIKLVPSSPTTGYLNNSNFHTGAKSLEIIQGQKHTLSIPATYNASYYYYQPRFSNRFIVSAWFKLPAGSKPQITFNGINGTVNSDNITIEGWQKVEAEFYSPSSGGSPSIEFSVNGGTGSGYIDDIRIQPFKSTMKTFVYDPNTLWLKAELDNQNYATFYNYDEEGTLTQVKKETVMGVQTLKTTRSHIMKNPNE